MIRPVNKYGRYSRLLLLAVLGFACISTMAAIEPLSEYKLKSIYLYNFTRLTQLPEQHFSDNNTYHLCIIGNNLLGKYLALLAAQPVDGHPLSVERIYNPKGLSGCEMLFISRSEKRKLHTWLKQAAVLKILTVSDIDGFARHGGMIGLVLHGNRVKFEINHMAARRCNISISAKLLELGDIVSDGRGENATCRL